MTSKGQVRQKRMEADVFKDIEASQNAFKALQKNEYTDLKYKVNEPLGKAGQPPRYPSAESHDKMEK